MGGLGVLPLDQYIGQEKIKCRPELGPGWPQVETQRIGVWLIMEFPRPKEGLRLSRGQGTCVSHQLHLCCVVNHFVVLFGSR